MADLLYPNTSCGSWSQLAELFYRKYEVYRMGWFEMDLSQYYLTAAPFGGPIAMVRDPRKIIVLKGGEPFIPTIKVFTASGKRLNEWVWPVKKVGPLAGFGWTERALLTCIAINGNSVVYNAFGRQVGEFSLKAEMQDNEQILQTQHWGDGFVAMTSTWDFIAVTGLDAGNPSIFRLSSSGMMAEPSCWVVVPPEVGETSPSVLVSPPTGSIVVIDRNSAVDRGLSNKPFTRMCVSCTAGTSAPRVLACFSAPFVWIFTADLSRKLLEWDTQSEIAPTQMAWCGGDSIVLYWDQMLVMVGPHGDWVKYGYDQPLWLISEPDGLRIFSNELHEWLERVPEVTEQIFQIGSLAPGSMLYAALEHFEAKSPKADDDLRDVRESLDLAVDCCIAAAANEWGHAAQRQLLRAASLGRTFLESYQADEFVSMCKTLRVLNAVRNFEIGLPVTFAELRFVTVEGLVKRLLNMDNHLLASRIAESLGKHSLSLDVVTDWACKKVITAVGDDASVGAQIFAMLRDRRGVPYARIAEAARVAKREQLAKELIECEPSVSEQVPLLLKMGLEDLALQKAIDSGDTDLSMVVIQGIIQAKKAGWFDSIRNKPAALELLLTYCRESNPEMLRAILKELELHAMYAKVYVWDGYKQTGLEPMLASLQTAQQIFGMGQRTDPHCAVATKLAEEHIKLMLMQREIDISAAASASKVPGAVKRPPLFGLSLAETITRLLMLGDLKTAGKLKSEFKMSDKKYWWLRIKAIMEDPDKSARFMQLDHLIKEKKSPIGFEPFADVCIEAKAPEEAVKFIQMIQDPGRRCEYFMRAAKWHEAADCAFKDKNPELLQQVQQRCNVPAEQAYIDTLLSQFRR